MENTIEKREMPIEDLKVLTPEEHILIGSSEGIPPGETSIGLLEKAKAGDERAIGLLRTPVSVQEGVKSVAELNLVRAGHLRGVLQVLSPEYQVLLAKEGIEVETTPRPVDEKTGMAPGKWDVRLVRGTTGELIEGEKLENLSLEPEFEPFFSLRPAVGEHRILQSIF